MNFRQMFPIVYTYNYLINQIYTSRNMNRLLKPCHLMPRRNAYSTGYLENQLSRNIGIELNKNNSGVQQRQSQKISKRLTIQTCYFNSTEKIPRAGQKFNSQGSIQNSLNATLYFSPKSLTIRAPYFHSNQKNNGTPNQKNSQIDSNQTVLEQPLINIAQKQERKEEESAKNSQKQKQNDQSNSRTWYKRSFQKLTSLRLSHVVCLSGIAYLVYLRYAYPFYISTKFFQFRDDFLALSQWVFKEQRNLRYYSNNQRIKMIEKHLNQDISQELSELQFNEDGVYESIKKELTDSYYHSDRDRYHITTLYGRKGIGKTASLKHFVMAKRREHKQEMQRLKKNPNSQQKPKTPAIFYLCIQQGQKNKVKNIMDWKNTNIANLLYSMKNTKAFKHFLKENYYPSTDSHQFCTLIVDNVQHFDRLLTHTDSQRLQADDIFLTFSDMNQRGIRVVLVSNDVNFCHDKLTKIYRLRSHHHSLERIQLTKNDLEKFLALKRNLSYEARNKIFEYYDNKRDAQQAIDLYLEGKNKKDLTQSQAVLEIQKYYRQQVRYFKQFFTTNNGKDGFHQDLLTICYQKQGIIHNRDFLKNHQILHQSSQFNSLTVQSAFEQFLDENQKGNKHRCVETFK